LLHALEALDGLGEALLKPYARRVERWVAIIGQRTADRDRVAAHDFDHSVVAVFHCPLDRPYPSDALLQFLFGMPIGLKERFDGFSQIAEYRSGSGVWEVSFAGLGHMTNPTSHHVPDVISSSAC